MPDDDWSGFRRKMPVAERWAYLDHAAVAPLSGPACEAIREWAGDVAESGDVNWARWRMKLEAVRQLGAKLLHADHRDVALIRSTTEGINLVAEGFPWKPGDNVVVPECEFPSNLYPWRLLESRGVEVRMIPAENERLDLQAVASACNDRTRIVAVSWVGYATGWRNDLDALAEIAHARGALLFVDAIQGLGVLPLDLQATPIDFLAADGHKWLLGPEGAGLFFLRREHLDLLRPVGVGWNSATTAGNYSVKEVHLKDSAARYEGGTYCVGNLLGLGASLELLLDAGVERIASRLAAVVGEFCEGLSNLGATIVTAREADRRSGIVAFELPGRDPATIRERCLSAGVVLSCRGGRLRISPHVYTNSEDARRLFESLAP